MQLYNAVSQSIILMATHKFMNQSHSTNFVDNHNHNHKQEWSDDELGILQSYDLEIPSVPMEYKDNNNSNGNLNANMPAIKPIRLQSVDVGAVGLVSRFKSLPGHIEKGFGKIKSVSTTNIGKVPIKPYGGHVEASQSAIEEEFGASIQHIKEYNVKKRNKLGRDKRRSAVVDIPLQVLRIKDTTGKTHKEHIVSSISDHALVGSEPMATQIIVEYYLYFHLNQTINNKLIIKICKHNHRLNFMIIEIIF